MFEGILCVQFIHKVSKSSFTVCVCYLPPIRSLDSHLVIDNYHSGDFQDFNARCGGLDDLDNSFEPEDSISKGVIIDWTVNNLGKDLVSTLRFLELCILNGALLA